MLVWSLNVVVAYIDDSWSSSNLTFDRYGYNSIGPDVSRLPEIKQLMSQFGFPPVSGDPVKPVRKVVFRFSALATNGSITVLGDTEAIDIISNNQGVVVEQLGNNSFFVSGLTNVAPIDIILSATSIAENLGPNAVVGTLSTTDINTGNTFVYSLVTGDGDTDNSAFNLLGESLRATGDLDYEVKSSYSVRVRSTDQGGLFTEKAFVISVLSNPSWIENALSALNADYSLIESSAGDLQYRFLDDVAYAVLMGDDPDTAILTQSNRGINNGGFNIYGSESGVSGGNYLNTNLTQDFVDVGNGGIIESIVSFNDKIWASIPYTHTQADGNSPPPYNDPPMDGSIQDGTAYFGPGSSYFTNMYPGTFIMVADGMSIREFSVSGLVGADYDGQVESQVISPVGTKNWTMYVKILDNFTAHIILVPGDVQNILYHDGSHWEHDDHSIYAPPEVPTINRMIFIMVANEAHNIENNTVETIAQQVLGIIPNT